MALIGASADDVSLAGRGTDEFGIGAVRKEGVCGRGWILWGHVRHFQV